MKTLRSVPAMKRKNWVLARRRLFTMWVAGTLIVVGLIAGGFIVGLTQKSRLVGTLKSLGAPVFDKTGAVLDGPGNYLRSALSAESLDTLLIDIKFKHIEKIRTTRKEVLKLGVLNTTAEDFVPATIRYRDRSIDVKLRLKGDTIRHLRGGKWSFMVKFKGSDQLFGMRRFSLMSPTVRGNQLEPLAFALLRKLGLLAPNFCS